MSRSCDFLVYGATGFTGRQTAAEMLLRARKYGFKLGIGGRSADKLAAVCQTIGASEGEVVCFVADAQDRAALDRMIRATRVILNTAGPFSIYAPLIYELCVEHRTDYLDITGETAFVRRMIDLHHENARQREVRLVPFAGFDSVPSDLGTFHHFLEWQKQYGPDKPLEHVVGLFEGRGGINGGSLASAVEMVESGDFAVAQQTDLLCDRFKPKQAPDWTKPRWNATLRTWTAPFIMAPINTRIVRRAQSFFATESGDLARLSELLYEEGFLFKEKLPLKSTLMTFILGASTLFLGMGWSRRLLRKLLPAPGVGPTEKQMDGGFARTTFVGSGGGAVLVTRYSDVGDPGNRVTVRIFCECALLLGLPDERAQLPPVYGLLPPSYLFREHLIERLRAVGAKFETLETPAPRLASGPPKH